MQINPCPVCKSPAILDCGAASECYGNAWQRMAIDCTQQFNDKCLCSLSLDLDFWYTKANAEDLLIGLWNQLGNK